MNLGNGRYRRKCAPCHSRNIRGRSHPTGRQRKTLKYRKDFCERCGFKAEHPCQLDVDHIDGNHKNDDPRNYQTLCANCHRLKTFLNKDWLNATHLPVEGAHLRLLPCG